jgi:hypothetical protein
MIEVNTMILENGVEYTEIDNLVCDNIKYVLLSNINNTKDSCIRKISYENNKEYICRLKDESEFEKILNLFLEKNKALFS